ncbi:MAG: 6-phosphofructokinase [Candidatus Magasanikbacteria bacterium GW2011_GWC2_41_17]|uniref:Pyrophosphate--fructose 6-phosphate 1-phosphotransferase n=1 Tax=Candidatus Magasanikbacteria bacterium GW2011_GWC2_41_17 TaxID=1619048 RepID=A0A0G0VGR9_9BACT|nr:MAG: 6-phosphofructokinase [Candidatus Magasanikbacteria bacterium GW2011_GWC2_41_17]
MINQSLVGAILEARKFSEISKIYGARYGVAGIIKANFLDLTESTTHNLEQVANTPGAALGSTRDKPDAAYCQKMFNVMKERGIKYFYYIGGNDSAETCRIINNEAKTTNYELRVIHIPKTIDNDIASTDHCPGYGSAAKFVARAFAGVNLDNLALPGVYIGVVMGRHAGFLTAASILAKKFSDDGPHLIYLPEKVFSTEKFIADVETVYQKYGRCVVAMSEGVCDETGEPVAAKLQKQKECDSHGNVQLSGNTALGDLLGDLVKEKTKIKRVRADTLGYLQRSFLGCVSDVDKHEAREVGEKAVQYSVWRDVDGSVAIKRAGDYAVCYELATLEQAAAKARSMPAEFIIGDNMVTSAFINYARPLVGEIGNVERLVAPKV